MATNCINPTTNCCETCGPQLQDNCTCQTCSPVTVQCTADINNAVCVPILADQIYDCINIEKEQCSYLSGVTFDITPAAIPGTTTGVAVAYTGGPVCITGIGISYDFIGLAAGASGISGVTLPIGTTLIVDGAVVTVTPTNSRICSGTGVAGATGGAGTTGAVDVTLYSQAQTSISRNGCCCNEVGDSTASRARIIERGLTFWACNLQMNIAGAIGCRPFSATSAIVGSTVLSNPVPLSIPAGTTVFSADTANLGFDPMTFCGRICLPISAPTINITESFDTCLQADCVTWDGEAIVTGATGLQTLTADVELTFVVTKQIMATIQEQMAVFTTPDAVICKNGTVIGACSGNTIQ